MGKVTTGISMSLDGFIAGPNDEVDELFKWYFAGEKEIPVQEGRFTLKVSEPSAKQLDEAFNQTGAMIVGRRMFDTAAAWNGTPPFSPCFVVTHTPVDEWVKEGSPFTFVTDGIESAIRQAKAAAGDKNVTVASPNVMQQALKAGLIEEIHIDLVPVLLGEGIPMFKHLGIEPIQLEIMSVQEGIGVTHLHYRVVK